MSEAKNDESKFNVLLCDDNAEAIKRYIKGFPERVAKREKEFAKQAKAQKWTKANEYFEYNV